MTSSKQAYAPPENLLRTYGGPTVVVAAVVGWMVFVVARPAPAAPEAVIGPMLGMFWVTAVVWLAMVLARNVAVVRGAASVRYYADYHSDVPDERIERPARTFNNLMQVPTLFYVVCLLMLVTRKTDAAQVWLAWTFVAFRAAHALVYAVPYRFAVWTASFLALAVLWYRFGALAAFG